MNECEFCERSFHNEKNLINHSCIKKRRWLNRDSPEIRLAFLAWNRFYELSSSNAKNKRSFKDFLNSKFYLGFIKFGKHIIDCNVINPTRFIDFVIKGNIPLDHWCHDTVYEQYVREYTKSELPEDALERMILLMQQWSMQTGEPWYDFFRKINTNLAIQWLQSGRISPWILYNADSTNNFLDRCSSEQLNMITKWAPNASWRIKFNRNPEGVQFIKKTLKDAGI
jgi:hypothetical protein